MIINDKEIAVLSTGREFPAGFKILGLIEDNDGGMSLTEGFDHRIDFWSKPLTAAERKEVAEFMIERWRQWGEP